MALNFHPEAEAEFDGAYLWYENQRKGLGTEFVFFVNEAIERIQVHPEMYAPVQNKIRRMLVRKFPYCVFYRKIGSEIRVIAIFHSKRNPARWQSRK